MIAVINSQRIVINKKALCLFERRVPLVQAGKSEVPVRASGTPLA